MKYKSFEDGILREDMALKKSPTHQYNVQKYMHIHMSQICYI